MSDLVEAAEAVAVIVGTGAVQGLSGQAAIDLVAKVVARIRKVFGGDQRAIRALDQARENSGDPAPVAELASALHWYAEQDADFAAEIKGWAAHADRARLVQNIRAGRDAVVSGNDQTNININLGTTGSP